MAEFCCLDDEEFKRDLYQRAKLEERVQKWRQDPINFPLDLSDLRYRNGLSPAAKNIRNVRHKVDPIVDKKTVHQVEKVLRSLIETGFAENCDEELLEFDDEGNLLKVTKGITDEQRAKQNVDSVLAYKNGINSIYDDIDQDDESVSQSKYNDQSAITNSRLDDDGESDSVNEGSVSRKAPSGSTSIIASIKPADEATPARDQDDMA